MKRRMRVYEHHYWQEASVQESTKEHDFRGTMQRLARRLESAAAPG